MEQTYLELVKFILEEGVKKEDRTGTGTRSTFGYQMRFDLSQGFPLISTKKIHWKSLVHELLWFLKGDQNIAYLKEQGVKIWDDWADEQGNLGPIYGVQWRSWGTANGQSVDQLNQVIQQIKNNPNSRRLLVSAWNVGEIPQMKLPPCHVLFQFYVAEGKLSCQLYQRSADVGLGVPFNIASYALLTQMIAQVCQLEVGEFIHTFGDAHIYLNHIEGLKEQMKRKPYPAPNVVLNPNIKSVFDFQYEDIELQNYQYHPSIKLPIAV